MDKPTIPVPVRREIDVKGCSLEITAVLARYGVPRLMLPEIFEAVYNTVDSMPILRRVNP